MRCTNLILALILGLFMLAGCSSPERELSMEMMKPFQTNAEMPISFSVKEKGKAVAGLQVHAAFEMKQMEHGSVDIEFTEQNDGFYHGTGIFPMAGEWIAFITITDGKKTYEETITMTLKE